MHEFLNIAYTPPSVRDSLRTFDLYILHKTHPQPLPLVCFIHGGAWRSEDKLDYKKLAHRLASITRLPVAVPNYRLTPTDATKDPFRHPGHSEDILQFLSFLETWEGPQDAGGLYDPQKFYLMGHSCSAHMLASIFLDSSAVSPTLSPSLSLLQSVRAIIMSEGIYNLDLLLATFPRYREWFIEAAFGAHESYDSFSVTNFALRKKSDIRWLVIHSTGDSLVDLPQSEGIYKHLAGLEEGPPPRVSHSFDVLDGGHNEILQGEPFVKIVGDFILGDIRSSDRADASSPLL